MLIAGSSFRCKLQDCLKMPAMTSYAGLGLMREALKKLGLIDLMRRIGLKRAGYSDEVILEGMVLMLASGGRALSDWEHLAKESGFSRLFGVIPSVDTLERYLGMMPLTELIAHAKNDSDDVGRAGYTTDLEGLHHQVIRTIWRLLGCPKHLTLDIDNHLIPTDKRQAYFCYEKFRAYHPMFVYCPELSLILDHEFRDGNISARLGYKRLVARCMAILPEVTFTIRSDSAGYNNDFLDWLTSQGHHYFVTAVQQEAMDSRLLKVKDWQPLIYKGVKTEQEIAELIHCPAFSSQEQLKIRMRTRRYIAIRKPNQQLDLFPGLKFSHQVIVTDNLNDDFETILLNHRGRCGSVEYAHSQLNQCGMITMPSAKFEANAAYLSLVILTHNLIRFIQHHLLPEKLKALEIETIRFRLFRTVAIVLQKARGLILRFCKGHPAYTLYGGARKRLAALAI